MIPKASSNNVAMAVIQSATLGWFLKMTIIIVFSLLIDFSLFERYYLYEFEKC
jgi:hypothetical protein